MATFRTQGASILNRALRDHYAQKMAECEKRGDQKGSDVYKAIYLAKVKRLIKRDKEARSLEAR